ncbi:hypothetical protein ASPZODRAFT_131428 [Penicilliopsis zonata CBS 506.65]|uniref:Uncharacterized protein n=1 Tax=Penicilliopsis zonata CBS 506.65 TaxID=1073090 RepID=A0A1L9SL34_9EURO|nr:hypothetical protein ASPZODRAFT_131428 [Penicilliopsis zonata CBS 506.65]OJJ47836.1 hypothetical protein ASPZODRAFT_131428 [Penicilliopsis zonata CBS 506.65]
MLACALELLAIALWMAFAVRSRAGGRPESPLLRPESPRARLPPRPAPPPPSMSRSPSRSVRVAAPRLRIPPRSGAFDRPRVPLEGLILLIAGISKA